MFIIAPRMEIIAYILAVIAHICMLLQRQWATYHNYDMIPAINVSEHHTLLYRATVLLWNQVWNIGNIRQQRTYKNEWQNLNNTGKIL